MTRYCRKCGAALRENSQFCPSCGAKQGTESLSPGVYSSDSGRNAKNEKKETGKPAKKPGEKNTSSGKSGLNLLLTIALMIEVCVAGFVSPGFLKKEKKDPGSGLPTVSAAPSADSAASAEDDMSKPEPTSYPEWPFKSDPVDETPMPGMHLTAAANVLYEDTKLTITPVTEMSEKAEELDQVLQEEGSYLFSLWETDAGLSPEEVLPGEYEVTLDLEKMGVPEILYEDIGIIRADDNNQITELDSVVKDGMLTYRSDANSTEGAVVIGLGIVVVIGGVVYHYKAEKKAKEGYYKGSDSSADGETKWGKFKVRWLMSDIDPEQDEKKERLLEMEEKFRQEAEEEFAAEDKVQKETYGSLYWMFNKNLSVAERIKKKKQTDKEYQELEKSIRIPEGIQGVLKRIESAFKFLGDRQSIKMPKHRVEFLIKPKDKDDNLGGAQNTVFFKTYVDLIVPDADDLTSESLSSVTFRDNLLLTITHELFHVCQERYHYLGKVSDSNKFDEMTALVMEADAKDYYQLYDIITTDPKLTEYNYWSTMKNPMDSNSPGHTSKQSGGITEAWQNDHKFLQNQGYLLSNFVQFLRERTKYVSVGRIMMTRSRVLKPEISSILQSSFELTQKELDMYFRLWCMKNRARFKASIETDTQPEMALVQYESIPMSKNTGTHVSFNTGGPYAAPVRRVRGPVEAAAFLVIPDANAGEEHPEVNLIPCENYTKTKNGMYIEPVIRKDGKAGFRNHSFIEIYGPEGKKNAYGETGYTIWAVSAPDKPVLIQNKEALVVNLPSPAGAAKAGLIDGMKMTVRNDEGKSVDIDVKKEEFGTALNFELGRIKPEDRDSYDVTVILQEYVYDLGGSPLYMPASEPASLSVSPGDEISWNFKIKSDTFSNLSGSYLTLDQTESDDAKWTCGPAPGGVSIRMRGDEVIAEFPGYTWSANGVDKKDPKMNASIEIGRDSFMVKAHVKYRRDTSIECEITDPPSIIRGFANAHAVEKETAGEKVTYINADSRNSYAWSDFDLYFDTLEFGSSILIIRFDQAGNAASATLTLNGTERIETTESVSDQAETYNNTSERNGWGTIELIP